ncbi:MAG: 50S ribosomal protein L18 [Candidatus Marinimicrobia bacterium]|jgi:large subunit ribosomal protein L18|nr:50S ribosomal protein L18 [Candidatus Neomarinimicrobiota bacterium]
MRDNNKKKYRARLKKKIRIRKKIFGTKECPRLVVYRSNKHISAQIVNDSNNIVLVSSSSFSKDLRQSLEKKSKSEMSVGVGKELAKKALKKKIKKVVFDRNGYLYHGRIKALAEASREAGLKL